MISFWEKESFTTYDFIVVGGGIVGCSTAYHLKKMHPNARILIIEKGIFPSGASTKNAGFACFGSLTELVDDKKGLTEDAQFQLVEKRWKGLLALRNVLGDKAIGFEPNGGYELIRAQELPALDYLAQYNKLLFPIFKKDVYHLKPSLIEAFGFNAEGLESVVENKFEGQIDTGKMMKSWWQICIESGIQFLTASEVNAYEENSSHVTLSCTGGGQTVSLKAEKIAFCTNAFAKHLFPEEDIQAGRGMVMITKPISNIKFKGVFHYDQGYFYFRNVGDRLLIGGGRNLDKSTEETFSFGINPIIKERILADVNNIILPHQDFEVDMMWSGIMAFGSKKSPIVKKMSDRVAVGVRLGGMGVAIGTAIGQELQEMLSD